MKDAIGEKCGYQITGHRLSASYSAAKLLWIKKSEPQIASDISYASNKKGTLFID